MQRGRLWRCVGLLAVCGALAALAGAVANAAVVRVGNLVLRADGGFAPRSLPQRTFAAIRFQGYADIESTHGGLPPALDHGVLYFDRDGRVLTRGLPECTPQQIETASPRVARARCEGAIVGTGHVEAGVALAGGTAKVRSALTLFNGPRANGDPTVIFHAQAPAPVSETYAVVVPLERLGGSFSYKATIDVPPIAGGAGALTHADVKIGRLYNFRGKEHSYASARCGDGILETRGRFWFADGTIVDGTVFKPCRVRR